MNKFDFWQKWLFFVGVYITAFGLFMTFFNQSKLFDFILNSHINRLFWESDVISVNIKLFQKFIYGVLGAVMAGWGIIVSFIAQYPFKRKEAWSWIGLIVMLFTWFIIDIAISIAHKVYVNAALNAIFFILVFLPLFFTRQYFNIFKQNHD